MSKLMKHLTLAIIGMAIIPLVFTACSGTTSQANIVPTKPAPQEVPAKAGATATPAQVAVNAAPTKVAAPIQDNAAATPAVAKPAEVAAKPAVNGIKPVEAAVKPAATAVEATVAEAKPALPEAFMAQTAKNQTLGDILTDNKGMTLYTYKNDKPGESACYDACVQEWSPVLVAKEDAKLTLSKGISGQIGVIERKDGAYQVTYNNMPLYYYADDTKPGETNGQDKGDAWYVISLKNESISATQPTATETSDEWVVAEEHVWIPVVDSLGQHLQVAHQKFADKDFKTAATEIRDGATFLKNEEANLTVTAYQTALQRTVNDLGKLADKVEQGKLTSITELNMAFQKAYQDDIEYRLSLAKTAEFSPLVEMPARHFEQAISAFDRKDNQTATIEIYKAVAFLNLAEMRATGSAKDELHNSVTVLEKLADEVHAAKISSTPELLKFFAQADYTLASFFQMQAMEAQTKKDMSEVGYNMQATATYLEYALNQSGQKMAENDVMLIKDMRQLADELIQGKNPEAAKISQTLENAGKALEKLGQEFKAAMSTTK